MRNRLSPALCLACSFVPFILCSSLVVRDYLLFSPFFSFSSASVGFCVCSGNQPMDINTYMQQPGVQPMPMGPMGGQAGPGGAPAAGRPSDQQILSQFPPGSYIVPEGEQQAGGQPGMPQQGMQQQQQQMQQQQQQQYNANKNKKQDGCSIM